MPRLDNLVGILGQFDDWLAEVDQGPDERRLIRRLIQHNRKTQGKVMTERMLAYDADISVTLDLAKQSMLYEVKPYYKYPELSRPDHDQRVVAQFWQMYENGTMWGYKIPLQPMLKGWGDATEGYQGYLHTITDWDPENKRTNQEFSYAGITKRNWLSRLDEHLQEMRSGSRKAFHQAWRDSLSMECIAYGSELLRLNSSYEDAMGWEEWYVDNRTLAPKGLNMIPGGLKGLKFLHQHRIIDHVEISLEERDRAIAEYLRRNPRKGIPNPFISELWKDEQFYLRVMESREKTLSPEQVRRIRELAEMGWHAADIVDEVDALNELQVRNVLRGNTYKRMH